MSVQFGNNWWKKKSSSSQSISSDLFSDITFVVRRGACQPAAEGQKSKPQHLQEYKNFAERFQRVESEA